MVLVNVAWTIPWHCEQIISLNEVLLALRADAWLHAHGDPLSTEAAAIKARVRDAFYGDADDWKGMVAGQSLLAVRQAIAALGE